MTVAITLQKSRDRLLLGNTHVFLLYNIEMAVNISTICELFSDEPRVLKKGENAVNSNHVVSFNFNLGIISSNVEASKKDKIYDVRVSTNT